MSATTPTGYVNGSDMLLFVGGHAIGHCTSHTVTCNSETKDRAVKPYATASRTTGLWKKKGVTGLSVSVSADGLRFYDEIEHGYQYLLGLWKAGAPVTLKGREREKSGNYMTGSFVITSLEETTPAQDDATYKVSFENDGEVTFTESNLTNGTPSASSD
ncbi:MAG: hypothetical protein IKH15_06615 [Bacteroidales bacterium]|nr:hypothetical protein [Bacteroidales bacterium]MBR7051601.1 hypothetical protein [Bacteroidaceae bacterium]